MISKLLSGNFGSMDLIGLLLRIPIVLIALSVHECAHGYIAYKMGDTTAKSFGRLTLNPIKHLDLFGTVCMFLFGFGWAKPVPINARRFDNPKKGMALTALAGPVSNVILSFLGLILYGIAYVLAVKFPDVFYGSSFAVNFYNVLVTFLMMFHTMNLSLAIFNLFPIPPLDGSRLALAVLPDKLYFGLMKYEQIIQIVLMLALFSGLLDVPLNFIIGAVSSGMFKIINIFIGLIV